MEEELHFLAFADYMFQKHRAEFSLAWSMRARFCELRMFASLLRANHRLKTLGASLIHAFEPSLKLLPRSSQSDGCLTVSDNLDMKSLKRARSF